MVKRYNYENWLRAGLDESGGAEVPVCSLSVALGTRTSSDCETSGHRAEGQGAALHESMAGKVRTHERRWWVGEGKLPKPSGGNPSSCWGWRDEGLVGTGAVPSRPGLLR